MEALNIDPLSQSGNLWLIGSLVLTAALKIQIGHCKYSKKADISNVHPLSELLTLLNPETHRNDWSLFSPCNIHTSSCKQVTRILKLIYQVAVNIKFS